MIVKNSSNRAYIFGGGDVLRVRGIVSETHFPDEGYTLLGCADGGCIVVSDKWLWIVFGES
jgi:hypothetical protein